VERVAEVKAVAMRVAAAMEEAVRVVVAMNVPRGHVAASWLLWRSSCL